MTQLRYRQGPMPARIPGLNNTVQTVRVLYETDPEIARVIAEDEAQMCDRAATRMVVVEERASPTGSQI